MVNLLTIRPPKTRSWNSYKQVTNQVNDIYIETYYLAIIEPFKQELGLRTVRDKLR